MEDKLSREERKRNRACSSKRHEDSRPMTTSDATISARLSYALPGRASEQASFPWCSTDSIFSSEPQFPQSLDQQPRKPEPSTCESTPSRLGSAAPVSGQTAISLRLS
ncbi:hypothetical protein Ciccas_004857 [Cichlidogyrus casuarinus]|uniref:Uncharacterized protein n=1 Tax=Cichlidogyrus casuarinus TaxID=1844966 RepID=A0ABD2QAR0_9PLAT